MDRFKEPNEEVITYCIVNDCKIGKWNEAYITKYGEFICQQCQEENKEDLPLVLVSDYL